MVDNIDICKICLRTDVKLEETNKVLANYHYAVTNFALFHIDCRLCPQCDHLLRKAYNFNQKCIKAAKILEIWHRNVVYGKTNRKPLGALYTQVPQLPLRICPQDSTKVYRYEETGQNLIHEKLSENVSNDDIKQETDIELSGGHGSQKSLVTVKTEETNTFQEILLQSDNNNTESDDIELANDDDASNDGINDVVITDDASLSSDDEFLAVKRLRRNDGSSNNSSSHTEKMKTSASKKKHVKEDITSTCDNDLLKTKKRIMDKLQIMNEDLNVIYKNWEKTSLTDLPTITLAKDDSTTKRNVAKKKLCDKEDVKGQKKKKGVVAKLASISADLDCIRENCGKLINYKEGLMNPIERLRTELTAKFSLCGELKTEDGYVINKEIIMECFDRVSECLMRRLWRFVHGKPTLETQAINTLKHIQNKYQNEHQYESVFTIEYLNTKEKVAEEFEKRRTYGCYLNARYKCETCYLGFKYEAQMENHRNSHEEKAGDFACPTCGVRHKSKKSLDTHSKSHEAVYKCKLCPLVTYYRYSMMNHYHQHEGLEYRCEQCDTTFRSKSAYKTHCGLRHSAGTNTCTTCGRALASPRALAAHVARHQREGGARAAGSPVPCAPCNLNFASQHAYLRHARGTHTSSIYTKQKAKEESPKKRPVHTCRVCEAVGSSIGWLTLHFRTEHPAVDMALTYADKHLHLCEICGKGYANVYNLRDHLAIHAGVRAHACAVCGARFHRAVSLAQHALTHLPPRRACAACGKRFHSQSNLNNHMRGHIGDRRYKCNLCSKGFLHRNALNEHIRGVHYKLRRVRKRNDGDKLRLGTGDS